MTALLGSYDIPVHVHGFGVVFLLTLLGVGMGLGVIGALVAVRQRVRDVQEMAY